MIEFILFGEKITNLVELTEVVCANVLDSNYFLTGANETLDINLIDIVKPYLNDEEMKEFEEFLDML